MNNNSKNPSPAFRDDEVTTEIVYHFPEGERNPKTISYTRIKKQNPGREQTLFITGLPFMPIKNGGQIEYMIYALMGVLQINRKRAELIIRDFFTDGHTKAYTGLRGHDMYKKLVEIGFQAKLLSF